MACGWRTSQRAHELLVALHEDPHLRADALVDELCARNWRASVACVGAWWRVATHRAGGPERPFWLTRRGYSSSLPPTATLVGWLLLAARQHGFSRSWGVYHPRKTPQNPPKCSSRGQKKPPPPQIFLARTTPPFHRAAKSRKAPYIWQICRHASFHAQQVGCRSGRTPHSGSPPYHIGSPLLIVVHPLIVVVNPPTEVGWLVTGGRAPTRFSGGCGEFITCLGRCPRALS